jgi:protein arginine kinase activator
MQACEDCGKNPATIHLTQIMNESTIISHLCEECARKKGVTISITNEEPPRQDTTQTAPENDIVCPRCKMNFSEFKLKGLLGCIDCYKHFEKNIDALLVQVHGSSNHKGKLYRITETDKSDIQNMERLRSELTTAIEKEEFERAAIIRDAIHALGASNAKKA